MELLDPVEVRTFVADAVERSKVVEHLTPEDKDSRFWRGVAGATPAIYGSDSSEAGSLFDPSLDVWNLSRLPGGPANDLTQELVGPDGAPLAIPGLNRSMLYFGEWRSFFALHTEDCELQGASYLHWGAPKRWYLVPPSHAQRARALAANIFPEHRGACDAFVRHKTTLLAPHVFKRSNIPVHQVLQTPGTFVIVLASAFHFGFNHGPNCAEAVNFGLAETWLPAAVGATPCTCDGNQTPFIDVPLLMRRVRRAHADATADWWCFCCACGEVSTNFEPEATQPVGEQFECVGCGNWGHVQCYPEVAALLQREAERRAEEAGEGDGRADDDEGALALYCVACRDAWVDKAADGADGASWRFTCSCGRSEGASDRSVAAGGDAPTGRMFECEGCAAWSHTECYPDYAGKDDADLPDQMRCHRCRADGDAATAAPTSTPKRPARTNKRARASGATPAKKSKRSTCISGTRDAKREVP